MFETIDRLAKTMERAKTLVFALDVLAAFSVALGVTFVGGLLGLSTGSAAFAMVFCTALIGWRTL